MHGLKWPINSTRIVGAPAARPSESLPSVQAPAGHSAVPRCRRACRRNSERFTTAAVQNSGCRGFLTLANSGTARMTGREKQQAQFLSTVRCVQASSHPLPCSPSALEIPTGWPVFGECGAMASAAAPRTSQACFAPWATASSNSDSPVRDWSSSSASTLPAAPSPLRLGNHA